MQEAGTAAAGKRLAWPLRPIANVDQGAQPVEGEAAGVQQFSVAENEEKEEKDAVPDRKRAVKKRNSQKTVIDEELRHASDPTTSVADARPGSGLDHLARGHEAIDLADPDSLTITSTKEEAVCC